MESGTKNLCKVVAIGAIGLSLIGVGSIGLGVKTSLIGCGEEEKETIVRRSLSYDQRGFDIIEDGYCADSNKRYKPHTEVHYQHNIYDTGRSRIIIYLGDTGNERQRPEFVLCGYDPVYKMESVYDTVNDKTYCREDYPEIFKNRVYPKVAAELLRLGYFGAYERWERDYKNTEE